MPITGSAFSYIRNLPGSQQQQAPKPTEQVSQFKNQQVGQLIHGNTNQPQAPTQQLQAQQRSPVALSAQRTTDAVRDNSTRLMQNAQLQRQRMDARKTQTAQSSQQGGQQQARGGSSAGSAYTASGGLSGSRNEVLKRASSYIGNRYVLGGTSHSGIDCSGLVMMAYANMGFNVSQHSATWQGRNIPGVRTSLANLRPGDIVAWKDGSHIAVYAGNGEIIEAANEQRGVLRRKLWAPQSAVFGIALRLPGE